MTGQAAGLAALYRKMPAVRRGMYKRRTCLFYIEISAPKQINRCRRRVLLSYIGLRGMLRLFRTARSAYCCEASVREEPRAEGQ
jgi:hypothetical protein